MDVLVPILIALGVLIVVFGAIFANFHFGARASRGGVQPPTDSRRRGNPPFEGIDRGP
jgi:hypothetical protein